MNGFVNAANIEIDAMASNFETALAELAKEYLEADAKAKEAAKVASKLKAQLVDMVGKGNTALANGFKVESKVLEMNYKAQEARTVETHRFSVKYVGNVD